jgi:hypothetical protein
MESRNAIFFKDVFSWKETRENHSFKRKIEASSSNHHQLEYDEVKLRKSKKEKITKKIAPGFLTNLLENELQISFEAMLYLEAFYSKKAVNSEIESIMNNQSYIETSGSSSKK